MRILLDYRPALRQRTGVGEYAHNLSAALLACLAPADELSLFSSSWKDRLAPNVLPGAGVVDLRIPVRVLNFAWHRLEWPPVDWLTGPVDVVQSIHPLLLPSRDAVRFVTIHDLYFLDHSEQTSAEVRRDYAALAGKHARRADGVVVPSEYTKGQVQDRLGVSADRVLVCSHGAPPWSAREDPGVSGPILFVGTVEPRKNVLGLLHAYRQLTAGRADVPPLVLAGRIAEGGEPLRALLSAPPLRDRVQPLGYIGDDERQRLYREASMLVLPSFDEGFGLPALEAMTVGVPVIAARRGALPEVLGDAGLLVDPQDHAALASAITRILDDEPLRRRMIEAGLRRAREYQWSVGARRLYAAYETAIVRRSRRS